MEPYREHQQQKHFYLGTNCNVLCIDQLTGETLWQTAIKGSLGSRLVSLMLYKGHLYAACYGRVACLDTSNGQKLWSTAAKRLGEPASLALDLELPGGMLLAGGGGVLYAFSARTGERLWKNGLPGLNYHPMTLRVPGALVAQPKTGFIPAGKTQVTAPLEDEQYEADGFAEVEVEPPPGETEPREDGAAGAADEKQG